MTKQVCICEVNFTVGGYGNKTILCDDIINNSLTLTRGSSPYVVYRVVIMFLSMLMTKNLRA